MAFVKKGHLYHRCGACGHVFVWPQPTEEENAAHYRLGSATQFLTAIRPWFEELARRRVELLAQIPDCAPGRLLDLGAGQGFFVKKARDCGWQAEGVESSADAVRFGADDLGVELIEADLVEALANQPSGTWDVLTLWHSLEHTEDPGRVLRQSRRALRPGGCLVLNSPNLDSTIYRMLGRHWTWIYCPGHLQYFSLRSLSDWLEREGFTILLAETWTHAPNLYFLLEEACLLRVSEFLSDHEPPGEPPDRLCLPALSPAGHPAASELVLSKDSRARRPAAASGTGTRVLSGGPQAGIGRRAPRMRVRPSSGARLSGA